MSVLSLQDELHTTTPAVDIQIVNNFAKNVANMIQMKGGSGWNVRHNTVINTLSVANAYHVAVVLEGVPATNFQFVDNLVGYSSYGMSCSIDGKISTCWPSGNIANDLIVNFANTDTSPLNGRMLTPVPTVFPLDANYRLTAYKGHASDGKDPGVDMDALLAALAGSQPSPVPSPSPTPCPSPICEPACTNTVPPSSDADDSGFPVAQYTSGAAGAQGASQTERVEVSNAALQWTIMV